MSSLIKSSTKQMFKINGYPYPYTDSRASLPGQVKVRRGSIDCNIVHHNHRAMLRSYTCNHGYGSKTLNRPNSNDPTGYCFYKNKQLVKY
jgi:hypothetical protein